MRLLIFGMGYTGRVLANRLRDDGWSVTGTTRDGRDGTLAFDRAGSVLGAIGEATHIVSSVPPDPDSGDPVLLRYGAAIAGAGAWRGYLSSTGVYGDVGGAWVDETAPLRGRRPERNAADAAWLEAGAHVFRLPGIYGDGRSPLDRVASGAAHRVASPDQVFSRVHVEDIARGVIAGFDAPAGAYNLADDAPASQNDVVSFAARLLGLDPPPFVPVESLSPMARGFYGENRRVATGKARRLLGWAPRYPDYRAGLRALNATTSPASTSAAPPAASHDQR